MSPEAPRSYATSSLLGFIVASSSICYTAARKEPVCLNGDSCDVEQSATMLQLASIKKQQTSSHSPLGNYDFNHTIASLPGYLIEWTITGDVIELRLTAPTTGWIGFGISESGGMKGADEFVAWIDDSTGTVQAGDYHSTEETRPSEDDCDDWVVVAGTQINSTTSVVVKRKLDTGDTQDWSIINSSMATRVIAAYGFSDTFGYHGGKNRASTKINFFKESLSPEPGLAAMESDPNIFTFEMLNDNYEVPSVRTTYHKTCKNVPSGENSIVALQHVLDDGTKDYISHHFVVSGYRTSDCAGGANSRIWTWVPGVEEFVLPPDVGFPMGGTSGFLSIAVETHFDNPKGTSGEQDNSGVRFFYTATLRPYNMAVITLGDATVMAAGEKIPKGWSTFNFPCPNTNCFSKLNGGNSVTVISALHHMHEGGRAMRTRLYDSNGSVYKSLTSQWFDFDYQDFVRTEPFEFLPGTYADVECVYETREETMFGEGSAEEMCITYLTYYPALPDDPFQCGLKRRGLEYLPTSSASLVTWSIGATSRFTHWVQKCSTPDLQKTLHESAPMLDWQTFSKATGTSCGATPAP